MTTEPTAIFRHIQGNTLKPLSQAEKDHRLIERLQLDNARQRELLRKSMRNRGMTFENVINGFKEFLAADQTFNSFQFTPSKTAQHKPLTKSVFDKDHSEIAALLLSDWQLSECVSYEESNGLNRFNSLIASNRLWKLVEKFKRIVRGHMAMYPIEKIWLPVLGDMISGSIHDELALTNDLMDIPSTILAARLLILIIYEILELGLPVELDCTVGNHGRTTLKMPSKRQAHLSYDWVVYVMVQEHFAHDKRVKVRIHTGQFGVVEMFGHRIVVEHGYGSKMGAEGELESRIRNIFDSPAYRQSTGLEGTSVDFVIIGDKHNWKLGERYMVNGCLPGSNEYGLSLRLPPIGAIQGMFGISKKRIPSWVYPLDVIDVQSDKVENSFSEYTKTFMQEHGN